MAVNARDREESLMLEMLAAIDEQDDVTQRSLARRMNVALGLANSYLKRCVKKGWVKIHQAPANRYVYYLTPKGFAEKSRLTKQYLSISFSFYRKASLSCTRAYTLCRHRGHTRVVLCGVSDLAEIAFLRAPEHDIEVVGICDPYTTTKRMLDLQVHESLTKCPEFDACLITSVDNASELLQELQQVCSQEQIYVPDILGLHR